MIFFQFVILADPCHVLHARPMFVKTKHIFDPNNRYCFEANEYVPRDMICASHAGARKVGSRGTCP